MGSTLACWLALSVLLKHKCRALALDLPNQRSLHTQPTPKGGGIVIVGMIHSGLGEPHVVPLRDGRHFLWHLGSAPWDLVPSAGGMITAVSEFGISSLSNLLWV